MPFWHRSLPGFYSCCLSQLLIVMMIMEIDILHFKLVQSFRGGRGWRLVDDMARKLYWRVSSKSIWDCRQQLATKIYLWSKFQGSLPDDPGGRMGAKYSWEPDPLLAVMVGVVISIIVLIPAVCSVCFHLHLRRSERDGKVSPPRLIELDITWLTVHHNHLVTSRWKVRRKVCITTITSSKL